MKLRIGGLQTVIDQALAHEQAKQQIISFLALSMSFDQSSQPQVPANWYFRYTQPITKSVEIAIPFVDVTYYKISDIMYSGKKNDIQFTCANDPDRSYHFQGCWITEMDVDHTNSLIRINMAHDDVYLTIAV